MFLFLKPVTGPLLKTEITSHYFWPFILLISKHHFNSGNLRSLCKEENKEREEKDSAMTGKSGTWTSAGSAATSLSWELYLCKQEWVALTKFGKKGKQGWPKNIRNQKKTSVCSTSLSCPVSAPSDWSEFLLQCTLPSAPRWLAWNYQILI